MQCCRWSRWASRPKRKESHLASNLIQFTFEKLFLAQVDNQYPFEISPSPTFTQMDPYKPQYKVPRSISEEELIRWIQNTQCWSFSLSPIIQSHTLFPGNLAMWAWPRDLQGLGSTLLEGKTAKASLSPSSLQEGLQMCLDRWRNDNWLLALKQGPLLR